MAHLYDRFSSTIEEIFSNQKITLPKKIAIALSGGADSMALAFLLAEFCREKNIKFVALTVDHKMRKSSAKEASQVAKICVKEKIPHEILEISSKKIPQKNIEAQLREARYELLCGFCKKNKIGFLFLGHHAGDVAENFLIRLFRGSGLDGLSAMAEVSELNQIKLVRPLLDFDKDELKDFLRVKKIKWIEDESNEDEKFLRNKIRKFLESFEEKNLIAKRIKNAAEEISETRDIFNAKMLDEARAVLTLTPERNFLLNLKKFKKIEEKFALKILALVAMEVSGEVYKPRFAKLKGFYEYLVKDGEFKSRNFYGCAVKKFDANNIIISAVERHEMPFRTILKKLFR